MAKKFLTSIDLSGNQLIRPVLENVSDNPKTELAKGRLAFNTTGNVPIVHDGSSWKNLQYEIPAGTYLTQNDTITLKGVITGSGRTAITTAIADGALTIAKTDGLQAALNAKMTTASYPSLTTIQTIGATTTPIGFLKKTGANTWSIDTNTYLKSNANAVSATKLATARDFSITGGATAGVVSFNGSDDVELSVTALDASKLATTTTIPSGVLGRSSLYVGTTKIALNRASASLALTGITSVAIGSAVLKYDSTNNAIYVEKANGDAVNFYATGGVSALGFGEGGGSTGGGGADMLDSWANYTTVKANYYVPSSLLVSFRTNALDRLTSLENGSATSIVTKGTGNAITSITKSGTEITATKGTKFAELGADGFVLTSQLPSYVDDVLEFSTLANFPTTGESGKIYVATNNNLTYRWTGTTYVEISKSIALGTTSSTAYRGDHGLAAYNHSRAAHQTIINGTGFVKADGTTLSYDNSSYSLSSHNHSGVYQPSHTGLTNIATQSANATIGLLKKTGANTWTFDTNTYSLSNHNHSGTYEPVFTKNNAFNKNFGTTSGTVAQGNDSRFTNSRTPTKKTGTIGTGLTTVVTHGLGSANIIASVMTTAGEVVECDIINTSTTTTFRFNVAPAASTYKYVIIG